jgi:ubiquinone/menaquinone biosynthesis C-methylase UbiE
VIEHIVYGQLEPESYQKIAGAIGDENPIVDVGCGEGQLANFLAATMNRQVQGIDVSSTKLVKAREAAKASGISQLVQFIQGDASHLDFLADEFFGAIVSVYTLHELDDPRKALGELWRVLRAKGKFVLVDFIKGGKAEQLWGERYYTPQEIETMLRESGFGEVTMQFVHDDVVFVSSLKV